METSRGLTEWGVATVDPQHITAFSVAAAFVLYVLDRVINLVKALRDNGKDSNSCTGAHERQLACMERLVDAASSQTEILRELSENQKILLERVPRRSYTPRNVAAPSNSEDLRRRHVDAAREAITDPPSSGHRTRR